MLHIYMSYNICSIKIMAGFEQKLNMNETTYASYCTMKGHLTTI